MTYLESFQKMLDMIEYAESDKLSVAMLADTAIMSASHLQRIFKQLTGQALMSYVRGRRLARSLHELFNTDMRIIDIANEYGFNHEQTYIRAFKTEFNCTPNQARLNKQILPIRERILPTSLYHMTDGLLYGPAPVMVPAFHVIGKPTVFHDFNFTQDALLPNMTGVAFVNTLTPDILRYAVNPDVYIGVVKRLCGYDYEYMPSLETKNLKHVPEGMKGWSFPTSRCLCFRYVGKHHYNEISMVTARETYDAIYLYFRDQERYMHNTNYHFERIDTTLYDGIFCQMDLYVPVADLQQDDIKDSLSDTTFVL